MSDPTGPEKPSVPEQPFKAETPAGSPPVRPTPAEPVRAPATPSPAGGGPAYTPPRPKRTSAEIRADIDAQRAELGQSVDQLRDRVTELTDWKSQLRKHRKSVIVGAVATGFVVGGLMALRRR